MNAQIEVDPKIKTYFEKNHKSEYDACVSKNCSAFCVQPVGSGSSLAFCDRHGFSRVVVG